MWIVLFIFITVLLFLLYLLFSRTRPYNRNLRVLTNLRTLFWYFFFLQMILLRSRKRMTPLKSRKQIIILRLRKQIILLRSRNHLYAFYQRSQDLFYRPIIVGILCQMLLELVRVMPQPHLCRQPACSPTWWYVVTSFFHKVHILWEGHKTDEISKLFFDATK